MPTVRVTVLRDDEPVSGHRVAIDVGVIGGIKGPVYTDADGVAEFEVEYGEEGDVYVDGRKEDHWGSYSATDITVNL